MRRLLALLGVGSAIGICAACGGAEFQVGNPSEAGAVDTSVSDAAGDAFARLDAEAGAGADAFRDAPADSGAPIDGAQPADAPAPMDGAQPSDAPPGDAPFAPDVAEEPPPHCGGAFACTTAAPAGWEGPVELYVGTDPPPSCSANFSGPDFDGHAGLTADPATCRCTCQSATDVQCSSPAISFGVNGTCGNATPCATVSLTPGVCTPVDERTKCVGLIVDISAAASTPTGGMCVAVPAPMVPMYTWSMAERSCTPSVPVEQADCVSGSVCAPQSASPFQGSLCIAQMGDVVCPSTGYTTKHLAFVGVDDSRGCTACSCGAVGGAMCAGSVTVHSPASQGGAPCSGSAVIYPLPSTCSGAQQPGDFLVTVTPSGGSCTPSAVAPTGEALPNRPMTFCCSP